MFTNITIKNFRCFPALQLPQLGRINLIAGKNNTGKTAVLEAIHIHNRPNDCRPAIDASKQRGLADPMKDITEVASWLFYRKAGDVGFEISSYEQSGPNRTLSAWLLDSITMRERFPELEKQLQASFRSDLVESSSPRLVYRYEQTNESTQHAVAAWSFGLAMVGFRMTAIQPSIYLGSQVGAADQDLRFFGELEAAKRQDAILPALQVIEPRLKRLALVPFAGESVIHGDTGFPGSCRSI